MSIESFVHDIALLARAYCKYIFLLNLFLIQINLL